MRDVIDAIGRVRWHCPRCTARAAGQCWQCGKRREKQTKGAAYCNRCKRARERQSKRVSRQQPEQRERIRRYDKAKQLRPGHRARNTAQKRAWMALHPEKFKEYADKARDRWRELRKDPAWWERKKARQRELYAIRKAKRRQSLDSSQSAAVSS
jgi:hypothetical protein